MTQTNGFPAPLGSSEQAAVAADQVVLEAEADQEVVVSQGEAAEVAIQEVSEHLGHCTVRPLRFQGQYRLEVYRQTTRAGSATESTPRHGSGTRTSPGGRSFNYRHSQRMPHSSSGSHH